MYCSFQIPVDYLTNLKCEVPGLMCKIESKVASEELPVARNQSYKSKKKYLNMLLTLQLYLLFGTLSEVHTFRQLIRIISGKEIKHHFVAQWGLKYQIHQKPTTIHK